MDITLPFQKNVTGKIISDFIRGLEFVQSETIESPKSVLIAWRLDMNMSVPGQWCSFNRKFRFCIFMLYVDQIVKYD